MFMEWWDVCLDCVTLINRVGEETSKKKYGCKSNTVTTNNRVSNHVETYHESCKSEHESCTDVKPCCDDLTCFWSDGHSFMKDGVCGDCVAKRTILSKGLSVLWE
eukprot:UN18964